MSTHGTYLAVFLSNKKSARWQAWYAMSEAERRAKDEIGLAALKAWDEAHKADIVYVSGPLGPTKRTSQDGVADVVNELTVFVVVRAPTHEAAAKLFEGHPHFTIFPCDAVDVMPLLGPKPDAWAGRWLGYARTQSVFEQVPRLPRARPVASATAAVVSGAE